MRILPGLFSAVIALAALTSTDVRADGSGSASAEAQPKASFAPETSGEKTAPEVSAEKIRAHYAKITAFTADVDQEKKAPFLARPLKSTATLSMKNGRIEWKTISPIASFIAIDSDGIHVEQAGTANHPGSAALESAGKNPKAAAFIGFLRSLFALDFQGIEKDFVLTFESGTMKARPKETSSLGSMIRGIDVSFASDLAVRQVVVETRDETTVMNFRNFVPVVR